MEKHFEIFVLSSMLYFVSLVQQDTLEESQKILTVIIRGSLAASPLI